MQGVRSPLEVRVEGSESGRYLLQVGSMEKAIEAGQKLTFKQSPIKKLTVQSTGGDAIPVTYTLQENYPNPFNPSTTIRYGLPEEAHVQLTIYDITGRAVACPVDANQEAGWHRIRFDASRLASGVYLYKLQAGDFSRTRKMLLLK